LAFSSPVPFFSFLLCLGDWGGPFFVVGSKKGDFFFRPSLDSKTPAAHSPPSERMFPRLPPLSSRTSSVIPTPFCLPPLRAVPTSYSPLFLPPRKQVFSPLFFSGFSHFPSTFSPLSSQITTDGFSPFFPFLNLLLFFLSMLGILS